MAKRQRQFKVGSEYKIRGKSGKERKMTLIGQTELDGKEILFFRPIKKIAKHRER